MFSASAVATRLRADDPHFEQLSAAAQRKAAETLVAKMGGDPDDILTVALVITLANQVKTPEAKSAPLIARYMSATRLSDGQTAAILEMSRPTVNMWKNGHLLERLSKLQRKALIRTGEDQIAAIETVLDELRESEQAVA